MENKMLVNGQKQNKESSDDFKDKEKDLKNSSLLEC